MHYFSPFKKIGRNLKLDRDQKKNGRYLEKERVEGSESDSKNRNRRIENNGKSRLN